MTDDPTYGSSSLVIDIEGDNKAFKINPNVRGPILPPLSFSGLKLVYFDEKSMQRKVNAFGLAYYLLSAALPPERCNAVVRSHWGVENRLHWRLDVAMNEDQYRTRLDNGPHNLAVLRHMALNVMQNDTTKGSLRGKFMQTGWDDRYLARLLALF